MAGCSRRVHTLLRSAAQLLELNVDPVAKELAQEHPRNNSSCFPVISPGEQTESGQIAAWTRKARDQSRTDRILGVITMGISFVACHNASAARVRAVTRTLLNATNSVAPIECRASTTRFWPST
jgi:hypothetical protein